MQKESSTRQMWARLSCSVLQIVLALTGTWPFSSSSSSLSLSLPPLSSSLFQNSDHTTTMSTTTTSLEQSLQSCSLSHTKSHGDSSFGKERSSSSSVESHESHRLPYPDATFELNSHVSLPYDWEQCLDLKTGEIFYVNWRNGEKAKLDPRRRVKEEVYREEDMFSEDDSSYGDSDESLSESSLCSSAATGGRNKHDGEGDGVLVVAGCRICLMYFMVSKQDLCCPKCNGQLLHFER